MARLKDSYNEEIRAALVAKFGYSTPMQAPKLVKVTLNMGVGEAKQDSKMLEAAKAQLATIAGQKPNIRRARKSVAAFKLREGMPVGLTVTLRDERAYEFLDRLTSVAIPRLRDFRGLNPKSFDGRGNYNMGIKEQIIFPEIDYDTSTRSADSTSRSPRPPRPTPRRSPCSTRSACPSRATGAPRIRELDRRSGRRIDKRELLEWLRHPRSSLPSARRSTRRARIRAAVAAGVRAPCTASSASAASACASSRTTASSPA